MISRSEKRAEAWGHEYLTDPQCESCGRSMMARFGGEIVDAECPSCYDEFKRLAKAGRLQMDGEQVTVTFPEDSK